MIAGVAFGELAAVQPRFDAWLPVYNQERPHQAIGDVPPAWRYRHSARRFPDRLPAVTYPNFADWRSRERRRD